MTSSDASHGLTCETAIPVDLAPGEEAVGGSGARKPRRPSAVPKASESVSEFCAKYGIGRTTFYAEVKAGRLRVVKLGRRTLVPVCEGELWFSRLPTAQPSLVR